MLREELQQLDLSERSLRRFGFVVGGVFAALTALTWRKHEHLNLYLLAPAVLLLLGGVARPRALRRIYLGWMAIAIALGFVVSTVLLSVIFYLVICPVGLIARLAGKDFLNQRFQKGPAPDTYWMPRARGWGQQKADYERQF